MGECRDGKADQGGGGGGSATVQGVGELVGDELAAYGATSAQANGPGRGWLHGRFQADRQKGQMGGGTSSGGGRPNAGLHFYLKRLPNGTQGSGGGATEEGGAGQRDPPRRGNGERGEVEVADTQPARMASDGQQGAQQAGQHGHDSVPGPASGVGSAIPTASTALTESTTDGPVEVVDSQGTAG